MQAAQMQSVCGKVTRFGVVEDLGGFGRVYVTQKVIKEITDNKKKNMRNIKQATFKLFRMITHVDISLLTAPGNNKFEVEGTYPIKKGKTETVPICALKNTEIGLRLYGVMMVDKDGKTVFIVTGHDTNKKRQKADPIVMAAAALAFGGLQ